MHIFSDSVAFLSGLMGGRAFWWMHTSESRQKHEAIQVLFVYYFMNAMILDILHSSHNAFHILFKKSRHPDVVVNPEDIYYVVHCA